MDVVTAWKAIAGQAMLGATLYEQSNIEYSLEHERRRADQLVFQSSVAQVLGAVNTFGSTGCVYCGNKSGVKDGRGNCISCGAP